MAVNKGDAKTIDAGGEENLFVYGTLRRGYAHRFAHWLEEKAHFVGPGRMRGRLYRIRSYVGLVPSKAGDEWVRGDVYHLKRPAEIYRVLDEYEGCGPNDAQPHEFGRTVLPVILESDRVQMASVYVYQRRIGGEQQILSGDFLAQ